MNVLHILSDGPTPQSARIIALHAKEHAVTVIDLSQEPISYEGVVDAIVASDRVFSW